MKHKYGLFLITAMLLILTACSKEDSISGSNQNVNNDTTFSDSQGNSYRAKKFGNRFWMIDNFKANKDANGVDVEGVYSYDNSNSNVQTYGRLYIWAAAVKAAPQGWRLPTKEEWDELIISLGGSSIAGGKLKESGTTHWNSPNSGGTNSSGFTALPGGWRGGDGLFYDLGKHGDYWGTALSGQEPFCAYIYNTNPTIISEISPIDKTSGIAFSVRYVKN